MIPSRPPEEPPASARSESAPAASAEILVFAKEPQPGAVKTRLSPPCTSDEAARLAAAMLADTLAAVAATPASRRVLVLDGRDGRQSAHWDVVPQRGDTQAERLGAAFEEARGPAVLIGMDTPHVTPALLRRAIRELSRPGIDAVIGAAEDGGWWLLGLRRPDRAALVGVPMSTPKTARAQRARLGALGLCFRELPVLRDVDDYPDALEVARLAPRSSFAAELARVSRRLDRSGGSVGRNAGGHGP